MLPLLALTALAAFFCLEPVRVLAAEAATGPAEAIDDKGESGEASGSEGYAVEISGAEDERLLEAIRNASNLYRLREEEMPSAVGLIARANADIPRVRTVLRALGYYAGRVSIRVDGRAVSSINPAAIGDDAIKEVELEVQPGKRYVFADPVLEGLDGAEGVEVAPADIGLVPGEPAAGTAVLQAERDLVARLNIAGYPYAKVAGRDLVVDHDRQVMEVTLTAEPGERARFGDVEIDGLQKVDADFVRRRSPIRSGEVYDPRKLRAYRDNLMALDIFDSVNAKLADKPQADGKRTVQLTVKERARRFVGFGGSLSTTEGAGLHAKWGHRNLFGSAERLEISGRVGRLGESDVGQADYEVLATLRKPDFLRRRQDLILEADAITEFPDAFERQSVSVGAAIERYINSDLSVRLGTVLEYSKIDESEGSREYTLVGLPAGVRYDTTDSLLDPTEGSRHQLNMTPYTSVLGDGRQFVVMRTTNSGYYDFGSDGSVVLAGRVVVGSIAGADTDDIPADKRFYAGGGGSIRGYDYQKVGPIDATGEPEGGRSLFEVGAELRLRYGDYGIVPFVEGGNVFDDVLPTFDEDLQWAAGLGFRYYTGFGPIRFDVAVPLNRRDIDSDFAVYISIGQAF